MVGLTRTGPQRAEQVAADDRRRTQAREQGGRGNLTQAGLVEFSDYFLRTCVDQVAYMASILEPAELLRRIELYVEDETRAGRLPKGSFQILREVVLAGEIERGRAPELTGYQERAARAVVSRLLELGLLTSGNHRSPLRLGFPIDIVARWFPRLYPVG